MATVQGASAGDAPAARAPEGHGASLEEALRALLSQLVAGWTRGNDENVRAYRPAG